LEYLYLFLHYCFQSIKFPNRWY